MSEEKAGKKKNTKATKTTKQGTGLDLKVKLEKSSKFGSQKLVVTVSLLQDGKEIATDSDFVSL